MIKSVDVNRLIQNGVLQNAKVPHSTSYPVLYKDNNKYYLAVFIFFYTKEDINLAKVSRPTVWAVADIENGEIIKEYETKAFDFSDAPYDMKFDVQADGQYDTSKKYYDEAFAILDSVRSKIIKDGKFYRGEYQYYIDKILANIPKEYKRFYTDLSI